MEAIMYFKVVYETLTPLCVAHFVVFTSPHLEYKKKITRNVKKSTLCFLVYLEIMFAHCCCNFHNSMKVINQMDLAMDATHKLI
jgi:hypothetical protein